MKRVHFIIYLCHDSSLKLFDYCYPDFNPGEIEEKLLNLAELGLDVAVRVEIWDEPHY